MALLHQHISIGVYICMMPKASTSPTNHAHKLSYTKKVHKAQIIHHKELGNVGKTLNSISIMLSNVIANNSKPLQLFNYTNQLIWLSPAINSWAT
jgi:hypothetical protein